MCCFGESFMKGKPEIMKKLSEEERLGLRTGQSQYTYEELLTTRGGV